MNTEEKKVAKMIENLNSRFQNLNMLYEKIETSKKSLEDLLSKFGTMYISPFSPKNFPRKMITEENMDLKMKLTRSAEEKSRIIIDVTPISNLIS